MGPDPLPPLDPPLLTYYVIQNTMSVVMKRKLREIDGPPFHQYQQNEQSPLTLTELTEHKKKDDDM